MPLRVILIYLISYVFFQTCIGQKVNVSGIVIDSASSNPLSSASVKIIDQNTSSLLAFSRTKNDGHFSTTINKQKSIRVTISYTNFFDKSIDIDEIKTDFLNLDTIILNQKIQTEMEVLVKSKLPAIRYSGDTTEYRADSFQIKAHASLEDLFNVLPGVQVNPQTGQVTHQGKTVKNILLDGEEFFEDNPRYLTKNIRADLVDKVQVYNYHPNQLINNNKDQNSKTINVTIKQDKKNVMFGKAMAGYGTNKYYDSHVMINKFKGSKKMAFVGLAGNTDKASTSDADKQISQQLDTYLGELGGTGLGTWNGDYTGVGFPNLKGGAFHYNDKSAKDNYKINGGYRIQSLGVNGSSDIKTIYYLPNQTLLFSNADNFSNHSFSNAIHSKQNIKLNKSTEIEWKTSGGVRNIKSNNHTGTTVHNQNNSILNSTNREWNYSDDLKNITTNILIQKKFKKEGNALSFEFDLLALKNVIQGHLNSSTVVYDWPGENDTTLINQRKENNYNQNSIKNRISYTIKGKGTSYLTFLYSFENKNIKYRRYTYNEKNIQPEELDSLYSGNFQQLDQVNAGGINYFITKNKLSISVGTEAGNLHRQLKEKFLTIPATSKNYFSFQPFYHLNYKFSKYEFINWTYLGSTIFPSIQQTQPINNNINPLIITVGNPELKPSFHNYMSLGYVNNKIMKNHVLSLSAAGSMTKDPIVANTLVDAAGRQTTSFINISNKIYDWNSMLTYMINIPDLKTDLDIFSRLSQSKNNSYIDNLLIPQKSVQYYAGFSIRQVRPKFSFYLSPSITFFKIKTIKTANSEFKYSIYSVSAYYTQDLPAKFSLTGSTNIAVNTGESVFGKDNSMFLCGLSLQKSVLKSEALQLKLYLNDIFNSRQNIVRATGENYISQTKNSLIGRYLLFSIQWHLKNLYKQ